MIMVHECGCITCWDDKKDHPMYERVCTVHRKALPAGWFRAKPGPRLCKVAVA